MAIQPTDDLWETVYDVGRETSKSNLTEPLGMSRKGRFPRLPRRPNCALQDSRPLRSNQAVAH